MQDAGHVIAKWYTVVQAQYPVQLKWNQKNVDKKNRHTFVKKKEKKKIEKRKKRGIETVTLLFCKINPSDPLR